MTLKRETKTRSTSLIVETVFKVISLEIKVDMIFF